MTLNEIKKELDGITIRMNPKGAVFIKPAWLRIKGMNQTPNEQILKALDDNPRAILHIFTEPAWHKE